MLITAAVTETSDAPPVLCELDIEEPGGRAKLLELAARADFLLESFRPGHLESLELGHDITEIRPEAGIKRRALRRGHRITTRAACAIDPDPVAGLPVRPHTPAAEPGSADREVAVWAAPTGARARGADGATDCGPPRCARSGE